MRKLPDIPPPEGLAFRKPARIEQKREYKLITPLYGGGVTPEVADPVTVVRAPEIRGILHFWWRATRGGRFNGDLAKMKAEEDAIWGKAYEKGDKGLSPDEVIQIIVEVDSSLQAGDPVKPFTVQRKRAKPINDVPGYASFPLQPDSKEILKAHPNQPEIATVQRGVAFTLTISYPEARREDIEAALWAWETFGGIGARTRRGFGALQLLRINGAQYQERPAPSEAARWVQTMLGKYVLPGQYPEGMLHLGEGRICVVTYPLADPMKAWDRVVRELQGFRQEKDSDTRESVWPEAEAIRSKTGRQLKKKGQQPLQKFPRAAFGLPIIFHFADENDPQDTVLKEVDNTHESKERFGSPLILRPLLCKDDRAVGLIILLAGTRVDLQHLVLEDVAAQNQKETARPVEGTLTKSEVQRIPILKGETDVLQAFMHMLKEKYNG